MRGRILITCLSLTYDHQEQHGVNSFSNFNNFLSMSGALLALQLGIYS